MIPLHPQALDVFTLAMPEAKKSAIYQFQDAAKVRRAFTSEEDNSVLDTVGKTIGQRLPDNSVTSSVVYDAAYLTAIHPLIQNGQDPRDWSAEMQEVLYSIVHEFGHCHDNFLRRDPGGDGIDQSETEWTIVSRFYADVATSEFLACYYSAKAVTQAVHQKQIDDWHRQARERIRFIQRMNLLQPDSAIDSAVNHLWFVIIQFAKLIGSCAGNSNLPLPKVWTSAPGGFERTFRNIGDFLLETIKPPSYEPDAVDPHPSQNPEHDISFDVFTEVFPRWKELTRSCNVSLAYSF